MSRKHKRECGCIVDAAERYVQMCDTHEAEWRGVHDRWNADYRRNHPLQVEQSEPRGASQPAPLVCASSQL